MQWLMVTILHTMPRSYWDFEIGKAEVQITYLEGDYADTKFKFTLYEPRDIGFFLFLLMTKNSFYFCFHNYEYGFDVHFLTMYMIFIHSQSLVDHFTGLL